MSDPQVTRYIRELVKQPVASQASFLVRLVHMPNIGEGEIKLLAESLVKFLTNNNAIEMLICALAPVWDNEQVKELVKQLFVAMPEARAKQLVQMMGAQGPFSERELRALHLL